MASDLIHAAFGKESANLYDLLGVSNDASPAQIRKGYYKAALRWHPDKNQGCKDATQRFQALGEVHHILSDPDLRAEYDATGCYPSQEGLKTDWRTYFTQLFKPVTKERISEFEKQYVGSSEERQDVLRAYIEGSGDIGYIVDNVMLANEGDAGRFEDLATQTKCCPQVSTSPPTRSLLPSRLERWIVCLVSQDRAKVLPRQRRGNARRPRRLRRPSGQQHRSAESVNWRAPSVLVRRGLKAFWRSWKRGTALARNGRERPRNDQQQPDKEKVIDAGDVWMCCKLIRAFCVLKCLQVLYTHLQISSAAVSFKRIYASDSSRSLRCSCCSITSTKSGLEYLAVYTLALQLCTH
ncbi:DnaJ-like subfamily C member 9 [Symbiodinium microadriaticum]|uniref:DnaJ-like subfamily C member 9 n=1 Tax=Symbiodinium microadriaticum TaxID=2951 RepID=A0A1Q9EHU8_SYMMI|nr:DnaJ-like subfamily C member 9 [Symbiodinium microadriaticum]CAE7208302.1 DNAJC9 [Symbiodinium sp. KB8]CAE7666355.1 DNAJC9 [Symbiodinium microadriaticum]